jgi:hypothetical protein
MFQVISVSPGPSMFHVISAFRNTSCLLERLFI